MKILYVVDESILAGSHSGVIKKVKSQVLFWQQHGHQVCFFSIFDNVLYDSDLKIVTSFRQVNFKKLGKIGSLFRIYFSTYFLTKVHHIVNYDLIYTRYILFTPFFYYLAKKKRVIMEINSNDVTEYKSRSRLTHLYNLITRNIILKKISAFVFVSHELSNIFSYFGKKSIVIANGADVKKYPIKNNTNTRPRLVFVGSVGQKWHGVDKIVEMAKNLTKYDFMIIGQDGCNTDNLRYMGRMSSDRVIDEIVKCDVGIGTLSIYRYKKMREASPLKTREYLSCGLPIIYAYEDTDLQDIEKFALRMDEDNIDLSKIKVFVDSVFNNNNINILARKFAEENLDIRIKEQKRLEFFEEIMGEQ
ncbi:glycosyltransferase family 4 protein [Campylobacter concisus]|uniref:glycosyltransferase family 4 protein n=1 Tax=Campylobacter concisus TaxID=199 RepID=UPI00122C5572|nr:glycosyltransferase family 4 protein [Campylobacter concisus]